MIPGKLDPARRQTLANLVHAKLRAAIINGELAPGERLVETLLAKQLDTSRSPIREAIKRLEQEGLVSVSRLKIVVRSVPPSDVDDLFSIRCALEGMAALLATPKLTSGELDAMERLIDSMREAARQQDVLAVTELGNRFHRTFISASGNTRLQEMLGSIKDYVDRFRNVSTAHPGRGVTAVREHVAILDAFRARDAILAERLIREHISGARATLAD